MWSHLMYFRDGNQPSQGGVGFLVNKALLNTIEEISSTHSNEEVEEMYKGISKALTSTTKAHFIVVMGTLTPKWQSSRHLYHKVWK